MGRAAQLSDTATDDTEGETMTEQNPTTDPSDEPVDQAQQPPEPAQYDERPDAPPAFDVDETEEK